MKIQVPEKYSPVGSKDDSSSIISLEPRVGHAAPQFSATDVTTNITHKLSDYAGDVVLLVFAGLSWCDACQFEAPDLEKLWKSLFSWNVHFLLVSVNENSDKFKTAIQKYEITFPALLDPNDAIYRLYHCWCVPTFFFASIKNKRYVIKAISHYMMSFTKY